MCTSITFQSENKLNFFARTMDFGFELNGMPIAIPRNYESTFHFEGTLKTTYAFVGTGQKMGEYMFADGVNEKGLSIAELYYLNEASYKSEPVDGKINLTQDEFLTWVLGHVASIDELKELSKNIELVGVKNDLVSAVTPLHFIVSDKTGRCVVVETNDATLTVKDNPVGVMTNSPNLEWHLTNLNNYLSIQPTNFASKELDGYTLKPFGQGSGTYGLPGGLTSPERFVRATYMKAYTEKGQTELEAVNSIYHILNTVTIPKGVNVKDDGHNDYTQYRAVFNLTDLTYYFNPYYTQEVYSVKLTEELCSKDDVTVFDVPHTFEINKLN
ncbi:penicillin acylase [Vagococcus martis]|uniref:Penicillin acylase n=1 Tax=Vagococcus martis TaxID=1768210 RepID=A0A1V4DJV9_9ENTE|nr:choloylglycine hydrolase family protein [Vagococcus martis]OPF88805.1 penicillin acylase [Vagococcus martis]